MTTLATPLNNAESYLAANYTAGSGSMQLNPGDGVLFGSPSPSAPIRVTVAWRSTLHNGQVGPRTTKTIYLCTGLSGDTLTGLTAIEGTSDQNFFKNDPVAAQFTAGTISDIQNALGTATGTLTNAVLTTDAYADPAWITSLDGSKISGDITGNSASISGSITESQVTGLTADLAAKAPLASPALTGTPTAPTAAANTNTTQIATTAYVVGQGYVTATTAPVTSVAGKTGDVTLAESDIANLASDLAARPQSAASATISGSWIFTQYTFVGTGTGSGDPNAGLEVAYNVNTIITSLGSNLPSVKAICNVAGGAITKIQSGSTTGYMGTESNHPLRIVTNNLGAIYVDPTGYVIFTGPIGVNGVTAPVKAASPGTAAGTDAAVINAIVTILRNIGFCS